MPKILESIRDQLLEAARRQLEQNGYAKTTIRSVAAECGIAVGTVYNYFPSKDVLIATFISESWRASIDSIASHKNDDAETHLKRIYDALCAFTEQHRTLLSDTDAARTYHTVFAERHKQLRGQLAGLIEPTLGDVRDRAFRSEFIAESLLTWTLNGKPFETIYSMIKDLIKNESEEKK